MRHHIYLFFGVYETGSSPLVPPKGLHLTVVHGVFASAHSLRDNVTGREEADAPQETDPTEEVRLVSKQQTKTGICENRLGPMSVPERLHLLRERGETKHSEILFFLNINFQVFDFTTEFPGLPCR
jgi:hypothetical protein